MAEDTDRTKRPRFRGSLRWEKRRILEGTTRHRAESLLDDPTFQHDIRRWRLDLGIADILIPNDTDDYSLDKVREATNQLMHKHSLGTNWRTWLSHCLVFGLEPRSARLSSLPRRVDLRRLGQDELGEPVLMLQVYAETKIDDIRAMWPRVQEEQKQLRAFQPNKSRAVSKHHKRNKEWERLTDIGMTPRQIADKYARRGEECSEEAIRAYLNRVAKRR